MHMLQIPSIGKTKALFKAVFKDNANSILIQNTGEIDINITLKSDHNFICNSHRSFKGKIVQLPQFTGIKKVIQCHDPIEYQIGKEFNCEKSTVGTV